MKENTKKKSNNNSHIAQVFINFSGTVFFVGFFISGTVLNVGDTRWPETATRSSHSSDCFKKLGSSHEKSVVWSQRIIRNPSKTKRSDRFGVHYSVIVPMKGFLPTNTKQ